MNKKEIYTTIYNLYELNGISNKASLRRLISRHFKAEYPGKSWNELTLLEQHTFTHILIKEPIFTNCFGKNDSCKKKRIEQKIQRESRAMFLDADAKLKEQNEINEKKMKQYYVESDTEQEKKEAYKQFAEDYKAIIYWGTVPTYEEWTKRPLRLYDYIEEKIHESDQESITEKKNELHEKINDAIIRTLIKIIEDEHKIKIDLQLITDCITFLDNYDCGDAFGQLLVEYDPTLPLSKERQKEMISMNREFQRYNEMLDGLKFYKKENG